MARYDFERTDDPNEMCVQCKYKRVDGSQYCPRHGANKEIRKKAQMATYEFKRDDIRRQIAFLAADPLRYNLEEDLAIMRATLQDLINKIEPGRSLFEHSDTIGNMVMRIEKLVGSCLTQAQKCGLLMTPEEFYNSVEEIMQIVYDEVQDVEVIKRIAARISESLSEEDVREAVVVEDSRPSQQLDTRIPESGEFIQQESD